MHEFTPAVKQLAGEAADALAAGRPEVALAYIREIPQRLGPGEAASCLAFFHHHQNGGLAETLVQLYSRDQEEQQVMRFALALYETGLHENVGAVLRTVTGSEPARSG